MARRASSCATKILEAYFTVQCSIIGLYACMSVPHITLNLSSVLLSANLRKGCLEMPVSRLGAGFADMGCQEECVGSCVTLAS
jgi:hypothetical protein